ncbi:starvation-inducible DNA-binding protein [Tistlia consotensis]|uniref:Starvation-inducible DNA-binding protein n=1 Tax=Tistlia consotensis USBA 355 TaxID=560819 RepID=A0A1Y6CS49_9PROT|nr:Dps family protein [Tistlia consotensis]SMF75454.1 starvation-inducible DNA-binding protein [Tistlia consotensis USBA 355]SNS08093.1 starvation-inducible DNA-binding protein [Tistlia consotensis]
MSLNTGIAAEDRKVIAEGLSKVLADSYTLYLKTHNYHWNVTGPGFPQLHRLFEEQYTALAAAVDEVAERIRILGFPAPGSYKAFAALASIEEAEGVPSAREMVEQLAADNEAVARSARAVFPAAESATDEATVDLLTQRMAAHEKAAWMLRATAA